MSITLKVAKLPDPDFAIRNKVFINPQSFQINFKWPENNAWILIKNYVFTCELSDKVAIGFIAMNNGQRRLLQVVFDEAIIITKYTAFENNCYASKISFMIDLVIKNTPFKETIDNKELSECIYSVMKDQFLNIGQVLYIEFLFIKFELIITDIECIDLHYSTSAKNAENNNMGSNLSEDSSSLSKIKIKPNKGILSKATTIKISKVPSSSINLLGDDTDTPSLFQPNWNFAEMGIGGLNKEFNTIFRTAFASRIFPPSIMAKAGIKHVKGIMLYGPPGTGKTLIARQIGKMLNGKEPKIVNGPSLLNKYVGQSEENMRELFADAQNEYKQKGDNSELHIIIFDEIDAICKKRGSTGRDHMDSLVNQLLSMMDGVNQINNILIIGMTNRLDMIDEALLRPGRFEVHVEISLPDEEGRRDIFKIHTKKLIDSKMLSPDININRLASITKNYTGAEIEGVVKSATSFALARQTDTTTGKRIENSPIPTITEADFDSALLTCKPAFGASDKDLRILNGIIEYSPNVSKLLEEITILSDQVKKSERTPLISVMLEGLEESGTSSLAIHIAQKALFPFIRVIACDDMIGYSEHQKTQYIAKIFDDAYKSALSCIILDNVERILDYSQVDFRYSNHILQNLLVLLKKIPQKNHKLFIIITTSNYNILQKFGIKCNKTFHVPQIETKEELAYILRYFKLFDEDDLNTAINSFTKPISIKNAIFMIETVRQETNKKLVDRFIEIINQ